MLTEASTEIHKFTGKYAEQQKKIDPEEANRVSQKMKVLEEQNSSLTASNEEYKQKLQVLNRKNDELKKKIQENDKIAKETGYKGTNDIHRLWQETKNYYKLHMWAISQLKNLKPPSRVNYLKDIQLLIQALAKDLKEADADDIEEIIKQRVEERIQISLKTRKPLDDTSSRYEEEIDCLRRDVAARDDRLNAINRLRTAITFTEGFLNSNGSKFYEDRMFDAWRSYYPPNCECFNFSNGDTIFIRAQKVLRDLERDFRSNSI